MVDPFYNAFTPTPEPTIAGNIMNPPKFQPSNNRLSQEQYEAITGQGVVGGNMFGAASTSDIAGGGLSTVQPPRTALLGPPVTAEGQGNRWQGRLKHGRGLPPGQMRRQRFAQFQQDGGGFHPGWRKQMGTQPQMFPFPPGWHQNQAGPQGGMLDFVPDRGMNQVGDMVSMNGGGYQAAPQNPYLGMLLGELQAYRSPGFQAAPQNPYLSFVPDRGMNQVAPVMQRQYERPQFDPFSGPF